MRFHHALLMFSAVTTGTILLVAPAVAMIAHTANVLA